jgi:hypothetical protein
VQSQRWTSRARQYTAAAHEQAQEHVEAVGQGSVPGDAEQALLDHLAALKQAVSGGIDSAPDLHALRNIIAELFERIELVRSGDLLNGDVPMADDAVGVSADYWLHLVLRPSAVNQGTWRPVPREMPVPIGQATPVPVAQSYPPGFLSETILGGLAFAPVPVLA